MTAVDTAWPVLAECPAPTHNSLYSARGRPGRPRCVCPHGLELLKNRHRVELPAAEKRRKGRPTRLVVKPPEVVIPSFERGACMTEKYKNVAHAGQTDKLTRADITARQNAKNVCNSVCPIRDACRAYILAAERPAGSWGSVWGGLDPWNRAGKQVVIVDGRTEIVPYAID